MIRGLKQRVEYSNIYTMRAPETYTDLTPGIPEALILL